MKEAMKKFDREKSERIKRVHSDIPREEKGEGMLCEKNGMSSENERKEKRDDYESKKEIDDSEVEREKQESLSEVISYSNSSIPTSSSSCFDSLVDTHGKVWIEKPKSLDELNPKVVDTTSPIEEVYDDENDKDKKNYFGSIQDKAHNKKFNKAIVDLTPMRKEKRGDVILLLHKTKYGMYDWFIHILGIPKTPKVFLEVMNYTLNSYVGDFIDFEDDDILMYNKSLNSIDKFNKSNLSSFKVEHDIVDYGFPLVEKRHDVCTWKIVNESVDSSIVLVLNRVLCDNLLAYDTFYGMRRNSSSPDKCELNKVFSTMEVHDYEHFNAYVSGMIEVAWIYHKSVQFDTCSRALVSYFSCPLEYFIDGTKLKLHVSFAMASRQGVHCGYISRRIFYWDDDFHMLYKGVFIHAKINWVKWTHGHYLVLLLPLLLSSNGCCLLIHIFLILRDLNSRMNCFQEEGN
ncbi:hypothetical protein KY290_032505 [Solanum tuberosum]|uniref:Ulp1 protease family, C-terminal catalytic domain containing protein n=1 Tax=Solanum tuberosum TaxID=4113 RepID=A0ABQ7UE06_SOLTU|nr:hypothetical protein KY285_034362 [Solanum tuberosum]KAH0654242.1 hypothetical protein KY289_031920 [Solanum tuberosum]KAH0656850.1 hypothetical protein KY285_031732 [Solanum tuberosum]KAH0695858.1 hypothetical protein KY289_013340 [Solanum tuberosum]KAH0744512.1 hypothetical protein KY290_032505 [Solanum tuberosum]